MMGEPTQVMLPRLLKVRQLAEYLGCDYKTARIRVRQIGGIRLGGEWRVSAERLADYLEKHEVRAE